MDAHPLVFYSEATQSVMFVSLYLSHVMRSVWHQANAGYSVSQTWT